jgi:hypothetical protein
VGETSAVVPVGTRKVKSFQKRGVQVGRYTAIEKVFSENGLLTQRAIVGFGRIGGRIKQELER